MGSSNRQQALNVEDDADGREAQKVARLKSSTTVTGKSQ